MTNIKPSIENIYQIPTVGLTSDQETLVHKVNKKTMKLAKYVLKNGNISQF